MLAAGGAGTDAAADGRVPSAAAPIALIAGLYRMVERLAGAARPRSRPAAAPRQGDGDSDGRVALVGGRVMTAGGLQDGLAVEI